MDILLGIETEYGITRQDSTGLDVVAESIALVRSAIADGVRMRWDYEEEDPHVDARGFRVKELRQDTDEANYFAQDAARPLTFSEIKSDLVLRNGARFYNDHAHPEYCTPECRTPDELVRQDWAGDRLVEACMVARNLTDDGSRNPVQVYKNNTDFQGHSYGCHENYLVPRGVPWEQLAGAMTPFLVTRQIYAGAGKFGAEAEDRFTGPGFQIAQRSDFFTELQSVDTMQRRPIINTRDEPHADPEQWRRFHVIIGDANLSPYATWLKTGATALVLQALVNGAPAERFPRLEDPLRDLKAVSRDPDWAWPVEVAGAGRLPSVYVQRQYIDIVRDFAPPDESHWATVLAAWEAVLDDLAEDPLSTADRLDWSAKYQLIQAFRDAENLEIDDPWLISLDLEYHSLDRASGLFYGLLDSGAFRLPVTDLEHAADPLTAPADTRAAIRGLCIARFGSQVESAQWDHVRLTDGTRTAEIDLRRLFDPGEVRRLTLALRQAEGPADLLKVPGIRAVTPA
ncbi:MAG: proteasome accessory factor PafA2 family protein [Opitutales bacterium]